MKVLLLATHLNKGGIAFYTVNLARHIKRSGVDVSVLSSGGDLECLLEGEGIPHIKADIRTKAEFGWKVLRTLPEAARIIKEGHFDLMHAQTRVTQVISDIVSRYTGVPYVTTCHGFFKHSRLSRRVFPCWGAKTIAISESVAKHLRNDMGVADEKIEMVYNGIDLTSYGPGYVDRDESLAGELGISDQDVMIGSIGRFSSVKGLKYLVEAFVEVASKRPRARLLLVGEGPEKEDLIERIDRAGISERTVVIAGGDRAAKYFPVIDIFCMPSVNEGLGLAMIEAMAAGKPCIASDVGGLAELVTDGKDGILVPPASSAELAGAILRLMDDAALRERLSDNAACKAKSFSIEDSAARTIEVYNKALSDKN
jgi:glycosyltransferase involved in cell wall biosynthesis